MSQDELYRIKEQAQTLIDIGRYAEAQTVITKGLGIAPDNYDLLCMMSQVFITQEKWSEARLNAEQAIKAEPNLSWAYRLHSDTLRGSGRKRDAIKSAKEAVKFEPYDSLNWYTLCLAQLQVFDLKEARIAAEKMRELSPDWYLSYQALALVASDKQNYKEVEEHLSRALELNPNSYESLNNMGVNLLNQKRKREAIEFFNRAAKLNPKEDLAKTNLEVAVSKYIPRIGFGFFSGWLVFQIVRAIGNSFYQNFFIGLLLLLFVGSIVFAFYWFSRRRFKNLPQEVQHYISFVSKQPQPNKITDEQKKVSNTIGYLILGCILFAIPFLLWLRNFYSDTTSSKWNITNFIFPSVMLLAFLCCTYFLRRLKRRSKIIE